VSPPTAPLHRALWAVRRRLARAGGERGSAVVEFLGVSLILLVPLVYLVLTVARLQAASLAAEGAARDAGRLIAQADSLEQGTSAAALAVELAFADQGLTVDGESALDVTCSVPDCLTAGEYVSITVATEIPLPFTPPLVDGAVPAGVTITASAMTAVSGFRDG
jgi:hypothetical protein